MHFLRPSQKRMAGVVGLPEERNYLLSKVEHPGTDTIGYPWQGRVVDEVLELGEGTIHENYNIHKKHSNLNE